jgi:hypothetical protein
MPLPENNTNSNHNLIAAIKHSNMNNGEVVIKLNDQYITGNITAIRMEMQELNYTTFEIDGIIR